MPAQSYPRQESFVVAYRVSRRDSPPAPTRAGGIRAPRDERSAECVTDARIQTFIREHDLKNNEGLHAYFNRRVSEILHRHGKRIVGWDAILHPDLPADSIVQASDPGGARQGRCERPFCHTFPRLLYRPQLHSSRELPFRSVARQYDPQIRTAATHPRGRSHHVERVGYT